MKIGIQGVKGSFHDLAASLYFHSDDYEIEAFGGFRPLAQAVHKKELDYGVMAIENTIAGSILPNYALMSEYDLEICGEVYCRIEMSFLVNKGVKIENINRVYSHPMALLQCADFLGQHTHIKLNEAEDTADSARMIKDNLMLDSAAIASHRAAEIFGLEVIAENIETNKENYTRFLILKGRKNGTNQVAEKASLSLVTNHEPGSLADVLMIFKNHNLNLTKIQSIPILGKPYKYSFNIDVVWEEINEYLTALEEVRKLGNTIRVLGEYKRGNSPSQVKSIPVLK
ncbi:MAG: prephenate dehydratase [Cyclobacteriaceae bacterium]|jgi:prephenate dehydratase|nr:prephenate dehydratase [Cyclobacteriaceae bacterium]